MNIDDIIRVCRRDTRCIGGPERLALCDEIERLRAERDEAREAARWLLDHRPLRNTPVMADVYERWPWLSKE